MSGDTFWVHTDGRSGPGADWLGPFPSLERAEAEAEARTAPWTGVADFAEVVHGAPGAPGRRVSEYYQGGRHQPGGSSWERRRSAAELVIPPASTSA
jgi:hypothetical protein